MREHLSMDADGSATSGSSVSPRNQVNTQSSLDQIFRSTNISAPVFSGYFGLESEKWFILRTADLKSHKSFPDLMSENKTLFVAVLQILKTSIGD